VGRPSADFVGEGPSLRSAPDRHSYRAVAEVIRNAEDDFAASPTRHERVATTT